MRRLLFIMFWTCAFGILGTFATSFALGALLFFGILFGTIEDSKPWASLAVILGGGLFFAIIGAFLAFRGKLPGCRRTQEAARI